ncbi:hypothetical protein L249_2995 [Ophiocordyceps polyrhachis-furcata BCC 54312]|uniref:Uncharacterized protein n=1 Tax=Ophiocordyceps polyrhachis-furcata BCC 54312 TaxID=1330021 RepID=A0A367LNG7_9HYPO|nr:hypothetical protein L249_2995 [Ophiocordyceps polyrhachis-furcata BCC 54312]
MPAGVAWIPARRDGKTAVNGGRERLDVVSASRVMSPTRAISFGSKQGTLSRWRKGLVVRRRWLPLCWVEPRERCAGADSCNGKATPGRPRSIIFPVFHPLVYYLRNRSPRWRKFFKT